MSPIWISAVLLWVLLSSADYSMRTHISIRVIAQILVDGQLEMRCFQTIDCCLTFCEDEVEYVRMKVRRTSNELQKWIVAVKDFFADWLLHQKIPDFCFVSDLVVQHKDQRMENDLAERTFRTRTTWARSSLGDPLSLQLPWDVKNNVTMTLTDSVDRWRGCLDTITSTLVSFWPVRSVPTSIRLVSRFQFHFERKNHFQSRED